MTDIAFATAGAQLTELAAGRISSRELLETALARAARYADAVNAVVSLDTDRARARADAADRARRAGHELGPLHGLPITIKDAIEVEGLRSTGGADDLRDHVPQADAPAVARLRRAGAIVFGKTNAPAWSADIQTHNELFGATRNPWDATRTAGGSSGGSAAAVASGISALDVGTDIGGSLRIPSHCCGVYALKPTYGIVPQRGYLDRVGGGTTDVDLNVFGPIARSADDLALALGVLVGDGPVGLGGADSAAPGGLELSRTRRPCSVSPRIGLWLDEPSAPIASDVRARLESLASAAAGAGWRVEDAHPSVPFDEQIALFHRMISAAVSPGLPAEIGDAVGRTHRAWLLDDAERQRLRGQWARWFVDFDALLIPVLGIPAFPHDVERPFQDRVVDVDGRPVGHPALISWVGLVGVLGLPSVVVPAGRTDEGLPVGAQLVAPWYHDLDAIDLAGRLGEIAGGFVPPPATP